MWKKLAVGLLLGGIISMSIVNYAFAQATILPKPEGDCDVVIAEFNVWAAEGNKNWGESAGLLGCAIQTGRVSLAMIPYFLQYFSNYFLGIVSLIALLFVVIGGFMYTTGGVSEQKDTGKTFITNALIGMAVAFLAWTIVNVLLAVVTR
jgi:hypothetical protein